MAVVPAGENLMVRERFLELVLSDPDLLDIEFAAVLASWDAGPPAAPPKTARRAGSGGPARRASPPARGGARTGSAKDEWRPAVARSPPPSRGRYAHGVGRQTV